MRHRQESHHSSAAVAAAGTSSFIALAYLRPQLFQVPTPWPGHSFPYARRLLTPSSPQLCLCFWLFGFNTKTEKGFSQGLVERGGGEKCLES